MLVLSRKVGESIRVGDATVTVLAVSGGRIKLGIEAPREIQVLRSEKATTATGEQKELV